MNNPFFSIGIPAFKGKFFKECIESILNQTYKDFELIIINDCSPDPIKDIVDTYKDQRIKYFKNEYNIGAENVVNNWNKCLDKARNQYFILMGDDDTLNPHYLEEFVKLINKYPDLDIYHCRSNIIDEDSVSYSITPKNPDYENIYDFILPYLKSYRNQFISDFVYRTQSLKQRGGFYKLPLGWTSDYLSAFIACGKNGIAHTNEPVFNYRTSRYNISATSNIELKRLGSLGMEKWLTEFFKKLPNNEQDVLKYRLLKITFYQTSRSNKISFIRQLLGQEGFYFGLLKCLKNKNFFEISNKDIVSAIFATISYRLSK